MASIEAIEGIGPANGKKLRASGIKTCERLLTLCCDKKGRKAVSDSTGIGQGVLLEWANRADLMRIRGVGSEYSDLLEAAGVDTVKELRTRNADNLASKMAEVNAEKKLTRAVPSAKVVAKWVEQAKTMNPGITY